ncbi:hypothetical protein HETIRDRAFT_408876 [Heterobasidion irregulare TC 32-1]|uniref:Uncharacterized protein n=1 Tax=Heterobasidion irregulare (strain TC 32-1) TaxID=747525 RepID=W4KBQ8_HETIT|nr:uncharacterized protein HETIRDRAFT_408876 [Heterobasidion irregulare TC 32-1]ETW82770.1 hypothetical protein HETIRDRAFT_408876 [Heterobasidion irregulare TC 32-1]
MSSSPIQSKRPSATPRISRRAGIGKIKRMRRPMLPSGLDLPREKSRSEGRSKFGK